MTPDQIAAIQAVATFIGGAKDRLGRPDPAANDTMREARQQVRDLATKYGVAGGHATYLDQCAALLRAVAADGVPACPKCRDTGWKPNIVNGERVWTPLMNDALPCECGALARKIAAEKAADGVPAADGQTKPPAGTNA